MSWPDAFIHSVMSFPELTVKHACSSSFPGCRGGTASAVTFYPKLSSAPPSCQDIHKPSTSLCSVCCFFISSVWWAQLNWASDLPVKKHGEEQGPRLHRPQSQFLLLSSGFFWFPCVSARELQCPSKTWCHVGICVGSRWCSALMSCQILGSHITCLSVGYSVCSVAHMEAEGPFDS